MNTPDAETVDRVLRKATARLTDGLEPVRAFLIVEVDVGGKEGEETELAWFSLTGTKEWHVAGMMKVALDVMSAARVEVPHTHG